MKNLKRNLGLPIAVAALAVAGAFASNQTKEDVFAPRQGYIQDGPSCLKSIECSTDLGEICTVGINTQVFGMNASGTTCDQVLYKLN